MLYVMPLYISNYQCSYNIYNCRTQLKNTSVMLVSWLNIMIIIIIIIIKAKLLKNCTVKLVSSDSDNRYIFELKKGVNVFLVDISPVPGCNCGFVSDKEICEHVIYIMTQVLGVKEGDQNLCQKVHSKTYIKDLLSGYKYQIHRRQTDKRTSDMQ